jgi:hypothetical protein
LSWVGLKDCCHPKASLCANSSAILNRLRALHLYLAAISKIVAAQSEKPDAASVINHFPAAGKAGAAKETKHEEPQKHSSEV